MMTLISTPVSRRKVLSSIGATGFALAASPVFALDRPTLTSASRGIVSTCGNAGVSTSAIEGRISAVADFAGSGNCQMTPDTVEGPYFICDNVQSQRDITAGKAGEAMTLAIRIVDQNCAPIKDAIVDVWQCDANGWYSGHNVDPNEPLALAGPQLGATRTPDMPERFLRGALATDAEGIAEFDMIYPGFYIGRAVHTHYKVHVGDQAFLTSQGLYPEEINARVMASVPYSEPRSVKRTLNKNDPSIIGNAGLFTVVERGGRLLSVITLAVTP